MKALLPSLDPLHQKRLLRARWPSTVCFQAEKKTVGSLQDKWTSPSAKAETKVIKTSSSSIQVCTHGPLSYKNTNMPGLHNVWLWVASATISYTRSGAPLECLLINLARDVHTIRYSSPYTYNHDHHISKSGAYISSTCTYTLNGRIALNHVIPYTFCTSAALWEAVGVDGWLERC